MGAQPSSTPEKDDTSSQEHVRTFQEYLASLYLRKTWSDVTICVGHKEFPAHRNILAAASLKLESMLENEENEKSAPTLRISDHYSADIVKEMLRFVYFREKPSFSPHFSSILKLYEISMEYQLIELPVHCRAQLVHTMNDSNALDILISAHKHNDQDLKKNIFDFICKHPAAFSNVPKVSAAIRQWPELLHTILTVVNSKIN